MFYLKHVFFSPRSCNNVVVCGVDVQSVTANVRSINLPEKTPRSCKTNPNTIENINVWD